MPSTDKDVEVRGVIVIKEKLKSKAKEKKQALSLWKRVGKRTIQELRKVGGTAAEVRRRYNLFRSKQPTARLRMGKVVQEWNPAPMPIFADNPTKAPAVATAAKAPLPLLDTGFNDLLSQVASASGIDIEKPVNLDVPTNLEKPTEQVRNETSNTKGIECANVPVHKDYSNPNGHVNLAFDGNESINPSNTADKPIQLTKSGQENLQAQPNAQLHPTTPILQPISLQQQSTYPNLVTLNPQKQEVIQSTPMKQEFMQPKPMYQGTQQPNPLKQENVPSNPSTQEMYQNQIGNNYTNTLNNCNLKPETVRWENPSQVKFVEKIPDVNTQSEQFQPVKVTDEKGISVSIQTRIINTRVTKTRTRRRKDAVFPLRYEYSDSTSEKESKKGFLLHKKESNMAGSSFKGSNKYKKRRKRNQVSFQEKISVDNVPYDTPASMENQLQQSNMQS